MAVVTRSVGVAPYQNGTFVTNNTQIGMTKLSPTRMVWAHYQTNPNWLLVTVIDVPGGIGSSGTPVVTNQQLVKQLAPALTMVTKINSTTVMVSQHTGTGAFTYNVLEVDVNGLINIVDSGTWNGNYTIGITTANAALNIKFIEHTDNIITYVGPGTGASNGLGYLYSYKGTYDATAKKLTWQSGGQYNTLSNNTLLSTSYELIARKVPGRDVTILTARYYTNVANPANAVAVQGSTSFGFNDLTGTYSILYNNLPNTYSATAAPQNSEPVLLPGDRFVVMGGSNTPNFYSMNYSTNNFLSIGSGQVCPAFTDVGRAYIPLTQDYFASMTRLGTITPTGNPIYLKVFRRVDQNFIEQSDASALNSNLGFPLTGTSTTFAAQQCYPEILNGKIFWWGQDSTGTKLSWTLIGLDQPAS